MRVEDPPKVRAEGEGEIENNSHVFVLGDR